MISKRFFVFVMMFVLVSSLFVVADIDGFPDSADRDNNGKISEEEADSYNAFLSGLVQYQNTHSGDLPAAVDRDNNGEISEEEANSYYSFLDNLEGDYDLSLGASDPDITQNAYEQYYADIETMPTSDELMEAYNEAHPENLPVNVDTMPTSDELMEAYNEAHPERTPLTIDTMPSSDQIAVSQAVANPSDIKTLQRELNNIQTQINDACENGNCPAAGDDDFNTLLELRDDLKTALVTTDEGKAYINGKPADETWAEYYESFANSDTPLADDTTADIASTTESSTNSKTSTVTTTTTVTTNTLVPNIIETPAIVENAPDGTDLIYDNDGNSVYLKTEGANTYRYNGDTKEWEYMSTTDFRSLPVNAGTKTYRVSDYEETIIKPNFEKLADIESQLENCQTIQCGTELDSQRQELLDKLSPGDKQLLSEKPADMTDEEFLRALALGATVKTTTKDVITTKEVSGTSTSTPEEIAAAEKEVVKTSTVVTTKEKELSDAKTNLEKLNNDCSDFPGSPSCTEAKDLEKQIETLEADLEKAKKDKTAAEKVLVESKKVTLTDSTTTTRPTVTSSDTWSDLADVQSQINAVCVGGCPDTDEFRALVEERDALQDKIADTTDADLLESKPADMTWDEYYAALALLAEKEEPPTGTDPDEWKVFCDKYPKDPDCCDGGDCTATSDTPEEEESEGKKIIAPAGLTDAQKEIYYSLCGETTSDKVTEACDKMEDCIKGKKTKQVTKCLDSLSRTYTVESNKARWDQMTSGEKAADYFGAVYDTAFNSKLLEYYYDPDKDSVRQAYLGLRQDAMAEANNHFAVAFYGGDAMASYVCAGNNFGLLESLGQLGLGFSGIFSPLRWGDNGVWGRNTSVDVNNSVICPTGACVTFSPERIDYGQLGGALPDSKRYLYKMPWKMITPACPSDKQFTCGVDDAYTCCKDEWTFRFKYTIRGETSCAETLTDEFSLDYGNNFYMTGKDMYFWLANTDASEICIEFTSALNPSDALVTGYGNTGGSTYIKTIVDNTANNYYDVGTVDVSGTQTPTGGGSSTDDPLSTGDFTMP